MEVDVEAEGFPLGRRDRVDEKRLRLTLDPMDEEFCCCNPRDLDEGFVAMEGEILLCTEYIQIIIVAVATNK